MSGRFQELFLPITEREREVATPAAAALSDREIAERLGISVRTVEGHVDRACTKLGAAGRSELAAIVARPLAG
ncbi:helix-turn-helix transcriptional regulator [Pseudonocardia aurantiaca]|uniref:Response regulator transcription factor n=1 Tax=Pseudonocardia aurantiaca TaxID=75290 RepID=A0ABW4FCU5_9PSEU